MFPYYVSIVCLTSFEGPYCSNHGICRTGSVPTTLIANRSHVKVNSD